MVDFKTYQVLIVDDDDSVLSIMESMLDAAAFSIHLASSAEEALEIYTRTTIDAVLTDIQMGGMSGFDLIKRLKLVNPNVKVIVMTGYDSYESVLKALQLGAYDYLQKPLTNHAAVLAAVQRASESAKLHRDNTDLLVQLTGSHNQLAAANRNLVEANQKLKRLATTDSLTNLYNRRYFDQAIEREISRRNRYQLALSIIMIDVDDFKAFNDTHGHDGGDKALKMVAKILLQSSRNTDVVARYGGEEFVVALPLTSPEESIIYAERSRKLIESTYVELKNGKKDLITISMGIAGTTKTSDAVTGEDLMAGADAALYKAKRNGKNCYFLDDIRPEDESAEKAA